MPTDPPTSSRKLALSLMMFLQYAVWGVWLAQLATYLHEPVAAGGLGFSWEQIGAILGLAGSIGALAGPFLGGQIADRFINAELWLGILLVVGGIIKWMTAGAHEYSQFLTLSVAYSVVYMPTLALTNSIAFAHLKNPERDFPPVRTWGTIGWIVASAAFPLIWLQTDVHFTPLPFFFEGTPRPDATARLGDCLRVAGVMSVLYGVWAMIFLPRTPPTKSVESPLAFAKAFRLLGRPGFLVVTLAALPIAMIHQVYFIVTSTYLEQAVGFEKQYVTSVMAVGQIAEILVLAVLGLFVRKLGYKPVLVIGCLAFALRYAVFAFGSPDLKPVIGTAMALHGFCYGFFFAGAFMYVDRIAPRDIRHSAQTVFGIMILGVGPALAVFYNGWLARFALVPETGGTDWHRLWLAQAAVGLVCCLFVAAAFRAGIKPEQPEEVTDPEPALP